MAFSKRTAHQRQVINGPECDAKTLHWTEVILTVNALAAMVGCAPGSALISVSVGRDESVTLTFDEHQEPPCLPASSGRRNGQRPGSPPT